MLISIGLFLRFPQRHSVASCLTVLLSQLPGHGRLYWETRSQNKPLPWLVFIRYLVTATRQVTHTLMCTHRCTHGYSKPYLIALCKLEPLPALSGTVTAQIFHLCHMTLLGRRCIPLTASEVLVHRGSQGMEEHLTSC